MPPYKELGMEEPSLPNWLTSYCISVIYPCRNFTFRCMPWNLARFKGECLNIFLNASSVNDSHSFVVKFSISGMGVNSTSCVGFENRFQGHTSWHTSQPNIQSANCPFLSSGSSRSFNSMV